MSTSPGLSPSYGERGRQVERASDGVDAVAQVLPTLDPTHGDPQAPVVLARVVDRDHVGVIEPTGHARDATAPARQARGSDP
jgi:hypothetical protein